MVNDIATPLLVVIGEKKKYFHGLKDMNSFGKGRIYAYFRGYYDLARLYDSAGKMWAIKEVKSPVKPTLFMKIMANTFWNPVVKFDLVFDEPVPYEMDYLKNELCESVDNDDDVLTQFMEPGPLKNLINSAKDFHQLYTSLEKAKVLY